MAGDPPVEHYTAERIANGYPGGDLPWQVHQSVRNSVVRCCRLFGKVGPMGECPIVEGDEPPFDDWPAANLAPVDFWVLDDPWNHERYIYCEIQSAAAFTVPWLRELMRTLDEHPGWGVGLKPFDRSYVLVFADELMVTGTLFETCGDVDGIVRQGKAGLLTA